MIIKNAAVYGEDGKFSKGDIYIKKDRFCEKSDEDDLVIYGDDLYAIPGLTDIHFHGCVGFDFCDNSYEAIRNIAVYQAYNGITTICPATMTLDIEQIIKILNTAFYYDSREGAELKGINLEGPFISAKKKGAQNEKYIRVADKDLFTKLQQVSGNKIKLLSIAPEEINAMNVIEQLKDEVVIAVAHSNADYDTTMEAFKHGARHVTHMYNAMSPFHHRDPGVIGAAFDTKNSSVELICDGLHVHPSVVRATFEMFGDDRIVLISDSMMATGMPDGEYALGGQEVCVKNKMATLKSDGNLAGSVSNLMDCMKNLVLNMGISLEQAVKCAAVNPAKIIGIYDNYGSIQVNKVANVILLDKNLNIKQVIQKGKIIR